LPKLTAAKIEGSTVIDWKDSSLRSDL